MATRDLEIARKSARAAKDQARVAASILQARGTPPEEALPPQPVGPFNYPDSEDDLEPQTDLEIIEDFGREEDRRRRDNDIAADCNPAIPEWARNPIRYHYADVGRIWCLCQGQNRWWFESDGFQNYIDCIPPAASPALTTLPILLTAVAPAIGLDMAALQELISSSRDALTKVSN